MIEQIIGTFNEIVEYCCTHIEFTIGITIGLIGIIVTVIFGIPAFIQLRKKKNGDEKYLHEYIEYLKKQLAQQPNADEQIQKLLKDKEEIEKRLEEAAKKDTWKQPVADAVKENRFDDALKLIEEANKPNDEVSAEAHYEQGSIYDLKLDYGNALYHFELAAKLQPMNSLYLNGAGFICDTMGKYDESIKYYTQALENETEDSPLKAMLLNNIGAAFNSKGEYDRAIDYYEKALAILKKFHSEVHPNITTSYNNIGEALKGKGIYDTAIEYYEKALTIDKKFYGEEHPKIATYYNNIGGAWKSKVQYDKAIEYYEKALAIGKKFYGEEHPKIATYYNNIGGVWDSKGECDKAIEYYEKALAICKKYLGENHPNTKATAKNLELARKARDEK